MTNDELQRNAIAISEVIAHSGASSEEFSKADAEISKAQGGCDGRIYCSHTVITNES